MSTATQRKAWNEAMRSVGAAVPSAGTSSAFASSSASDRRRKTSRREKARKSSGLDGGAVGSGVGGSGGMGTSTALEEQRYRAAIHLDLLEGVKDNAVTSLEDDEDDEYDELEELEGGGRSKKKRKRKSASGGMSGISGKSGGATTLPKHLRPRSLASILIEEASRSDSMAKQYVEAEVGSRSTSSTMKSSYPRRKFCPVTGLLGIYTDTKSGIPYATLPALEQIRERAPPWITQCSGGSSSYYEAVKSLQNDS